MMILKNWLKLFLINNEKIDQNKIHIHMSGNYSKLTINIYYSKKVGVRAKKQKK
jgi:hypothetical protein